MSIPPFPEDTAVTASLPAGPTYDAGSIIPPAHAADLTVSSDGAFTYTPVPDFNGSDAFVVFDTDGNEYDVDLTVDPVNDVPVANNDTDTVGKNGSTTTAVLANDVLGNDPLIGDQPISVAVSTGPTQGTAVVEADNTITYTPAPNYVGADSYQYTLTDGNGDTATVTVDITVVNQPPTANDQSTSTNEDTAVAGQMTASDPNNDDLTYTVVDGPVHAADFTFSNTGSFTYTPNPDFNGADSFTFTVNDGQYDSNLATVTITVNPVNDVPVANNDTDTVARNGSTTTSVLANDVLGTDPQVGDQPITVAVTGGPTHGTAVVEADNSITYTPAPGYAGPDSYQYTVTDGNGDTATATVDITVVNQPPTANDQSISTNEDTAVTGQLSASDPNNDDLVYNVVDGPAHAADFSFSNTGSFTYTPNPDFNGTDSFTFTVNDGLSDSNLATVTITVNPVNDVPVANNDTDTVAEDGSTTTAVLANDVLGNDPLAGDQPISVAVSTSPTHGAAVVEADNSITYTPAHNYNGPDSYQYTLTDGNGDIATATVDITVTAVNDAPTANTTSVSTNEETAIDVDLRTLVSDVETATAALTFQVSGASHGTITLLGDGHTAHFVPTGNYNGPAGFSYSVTDTGDPAGTPGNALTTGPVAISVTVVAVNDAPTANTTSVSTNEDTAIDVDLRTLVSDVETATTDLTFQVSGASHGTITLLADGHTAHFVPTGNYNGLASFSYSVTDTGDPAGTPGNVLTTGPVAISVTVGAFNDAPTANTTSVSTNEDTAIDVDLRTLVSDSETATADLTFQVSGGSHGTITLLGDGHTAHFVPTANYNGPASFSYSVTDTGDPAGTPGNALTTGPVAISVTVVAVNDAPTANTTSVSTNEDTAIDVDLRTLVSDVETATAALTFQVSGASNGTITLLGDGHTAHFVPTANYNGPAGFSYSVTDTGDPAGTPGNALTTGPVAVSVTVVAVNDAPTANTTSVSTNEDTPIDVDLRTLVSDVETATAALTFQVSGASNGTITLLGDGHTAHFVPTGNYHGPAGFSYSVTDTGDPAGTPGNVLTTGPVAVSVTVVAVNDAPTANTTSISTNEDTAIDLDLRTLVSDVETATAALTFQVSGASKGTITLLGDGHTAHFVPTGDYNGPAGFSYSVTDTGDPAGTPGNVLTTGPVAVSVTVLSVNDAPVAAPDSYTVDKNGTLTVAAVNGVLANDSDPNDTPPNHLSATLITSTSHGNLTFATDGSFVYVPDANFDGTDSFTYQVKDDGSTANGGINVGNTVTVSLVINQPTAITGTTANTAINDNQTATPFSSVVLIDTDPGETYSVTVTLSAAANGTLSNLAGGTYDAATGVYTSPSGISLAQAQSALRGLVFTPTAGQVPFGQAVITTFTIGVNDSSLTPSDNSTNVRTTPVAGSAANWLTKVGTVTITGNGTHLVASAATTNLAVDTDLFAANVSVQADIALGASGTNRAGLVARYTGGGDTNMYLANLIGNSTSGAVAFISRNVGGTWTLLATVPGLSGTGTLRFDVFGNTLKLFFNGTLVASLVDYAIPGPGMAGVRGSAATFDNFNAARLFSVVSFNDNFNPVGSPNFDVNFIRPVGGASVAGGKLTASAASPNVAVYAGMFNADVSVQADVALAASGTNRAGLIARYTGNGDTNMYLANLIGTGTSAVAFISRNVGGTWTLLKTVPGLSGTGTLRFDVVGNTLTLFLNGAFVTSVVDNAIPGPGLTGVRGSSAATFDNFFAARLLSPSFSDNFNRPNSADLGVHFTKKAGDLSILGNKLMTSAAVSVAVYDGMFATDVSVQADVALAASGLNRAGLVARYSGDGDTNMYYANLIGNSTNAVAYISRNVGGTWTQLATVSGLPGAGTLRFDVVGDALTLSLNGNIVASVVDDAIQGPGLTGVRGNNSTFDNLTCTSLAA